MSYLVYSLLVRYLERLAVLNAGKSLVGHERAFLFSGDEVDVHLGNKITVPLHLDSSLPIALRDQNLLFPGRFNLHRDSVVLHTLVIPSVPHDHIKFRPATDNALVPPHWLRITA